MKLLLTSSGISNPTIHRALVDLLGKPIADSDALIVPSGIYPFSDSSVEVVSEGQWKRFEAGSLRDTPHASPL
jgi:hypothetical protein